MTKPLVKYVANFVHSNTVIVARDTVTNEVVEVHNRPQYTLTEAAQTARWLNERERGYLRKQNLDHLYNGRF